MSVIPFIDRARAAQEQHDRRTNVQLRLVKPATADDNLHHSLDQIIDELDHAAGRGIQLTPSVTRHIAATLRVVRDCHANLSAAEDEIARRV